MAEKMENTDSWNKMIFRYIRARKDWISALVRRNRLEQENDTAHIEVEDLEVKKKVYWINGKKPKKTPCSPSGVEEE